MVVIWVSPSNSSTVTGDSDRGDRRVLLMHSKPISIFLPSIWQAIARTQPSALERRLYLLEAIDKAALPFKRCRDLQHSVGLSLLAKLSDFDVASFD